MPKHGPLIKDAALDLLSDKDSMTGRITDAGLDADTLPGCTLKNWQALQSCAGRHCAGDKRRSLIKQKSICNHRF